MPSLAANGYIAVGVDPDAPVGPEYCRVEFGAYEAERRVDAIVACRSLHHVAELDQVLDRLTTTLVTSGIVVVIEWTHEWFDERTARWCFDRLTATEDEESWLEQHRSAWETSGQTWDTYFAGWARAEGIYSGDAIVRALNARFDPLVLSRAPYFFADLDNVGEATEQAAIDADRIRPTGIRYVGKRR